MITIIVVTTLGWLTTQSVVEKAREEGAKELVALRASICFVRFQQKPDAEAKLAEFKALSYNAKDAAIRKFVTDEGLATMLGEDAPVPGAIEKCRDLVDEMFVVPTEFNLFWESTAQMASLANLLVNGVFIELGPAVEQRMNEISRLYGRFTGHIGDPAWPTVGKQT